MNRSLKHSKTNREQTASAAASELKGLDACTKVIESQIIKLCNDNSPTNKETISLESLIPVDNEQLKPLPASKTPSTILPQFHTKNYVRINYIPVNEMLHFNNFFLVKFD